MERPGQGGIRLGRGPGRTGSGNWRVSWLLRTDDEDTGGTGAHANELAAGDQEKAVIPKSFEAGGGDFDGEGPGIGIEADELSRENPGSEDIEGRHELHGVQELLPGLQGSQIAAHIGGEAEGGIEIGGRESSSSRRGPGRELPPVQIRVRRGDEVVEAGGGQKLDRQAGLGGVQEAGVGRAVVFEVGVNHAGGVAELVAHGPGLGDPGQQELGVGVEAGGAEDAARRRGVEVAGSARRQELRRASQKTRPRSWRMVKARLRA